MSIWASTLNIEDERQWTAELEEAGIKTGIIRDGGPDFDDLDAPIIYQGSHVLPDETDARGGSVDLAHIPGHVRFWRDNPNAPVEDEPETPPCDRFLRLSMHSYEGTYGEGEGHTTVILTRRQAARLRDSLTEFLDDSAVWDETHPAYGKEGAPR